MAALDARLTEDEAAYVVDRCFDTENRRARGAALAVRTLMERGRGNEVDVSRAFGALESDVTWSALFHLLQSIRYAPEIGRPHVLCVRSFLDHSRTALRVASLDAFVHLATLDPRLLDEAWTCVLAGGDDEKASIRARSRSLAEVLTSVV